MDIAKLEANEGRDIDVDAVFSLVSVYADHWALIYRAEQQAGGTPKA